MIIGKNTISKYLGFAISTTGYSHKNGLCQDSSGFFSNNKMAIVTVCDGHGDHRCFRSDKGSKFATDIALESIKQFISSNQNFIQKNKKDIDSSIKQLKEYIIYKWNQITKEDFNSYPLSVEEIENLSLSDKEQYLSSLTISNYSLIYGTTFIVGVITNGFWLILQIGDGDAVLLDDRGLYLPMPEDDSTHFQITSSLCEKSAIDKFRHAYGFTTPIAILLSSDGLKNSYKNIDYFLGLYKDILKDAQIEDEITLKNGLIDDLPVLSKIGSGDDISFAIAYDKEVLSNYKL